MPSVFQGIAPPFDLPSGIVYFHDWRYVNHGSFSWTDVEGKSHGIWASEPPPPLRYNLHDVPIGLELVAMPLTISEPVIEPPGPTGILLTAGSLIQEGGRYRLWYEVWPNQASHPKLPMGHSNSVMYAESDDGITWKHRKEPVITPEATAEVGYHGGCVFVDHHGDPKERYKSIFLGQLTPEMRAKYANQRPQDVPAWAMDEALHPWGIFGAVSPDGMKWTVLPDPLVMQIADNHNCCEYDPVLGKYVIYTRSWFFGRRTIGRMESSDFRRFPRADELVWPGPQHKPYELWYSNGKTKMPRGDNYHVMFPLRWSLDEDRFDFHLMTSPDNQTWAFVPGGPVARPGEPGAWNGGVVWPGLGLVDLPNNRTGLLVAGSPVPHKHPRLAPFGKVAWGTWERDRLVAARCHQETTFALWPLRVKGRTVRLNYKTAPAGSIEVEVIGPDGRPMPGRTFAECDFLVKNELDRVVTWKGESHIKVPDDAPVVLRFKMRSADLYRVTFA